MKINVEGMNDKEKREALLKAGCSEIAIDNIIKTTVGWKCITLSDR